MSRNGWLFRVLVSAPFLCITHGSGTLRAESQEIAVLQRYEAAGDCPDAAVFMSHFALRTTRVRLTSSSLVAQHSFVVMLTHEGERIVGRLEIRSRDGSVTHREVTGLACAEVVPALAFVAALTADPTAQDPGTSPSADAKGAEMAATTQVQSRAASVITSRQARAPSSERRGSRHRERSDGWRWALLGQFGALLGVFPETSPYAALRVQLGLPQQPWGTPGLQLGVSGSLSRDHQVNPGYARFQWLAAELGICPTTLRFADHWSMSPCAIGELGMLRGIGRGVTNPGAETRLWRAVGASVQLKWMAGKRFFLQVDANLRRPLARDEFVMVNEQTYLTIQKVPPVVGSVGLGVGLRL